MSNPQKTSRRRPSITTKLYPDNVAGVSIPVFKMHYDASKDTAAQTLGVACGGAVINSARETYRKARQRSHSLLDYIDYFYSIDYPYNII